MIVSDIKRGELAKYNLGGLDPPDIELPRKDLELIWDADENKWQVYLVKKGTVPSEDHLTWQMSVPYKGSHISKSFRFWLQRYDMSEGGKKDDEQIKKDWIETYKWVQRNHDIRKEKVIQEQLYEIGHRCRFLERLAFGAKQCVVPAGPVVGVNTKTGKPVRAYAKSQISKEVIIGG